MAPITLALLAATANAQCLPLQDLITGLATSYGERETARGMDDRGVMVQVYASAAGTFTVVIVTPDMQACMIAAGGKWVQIAPGELN